MSQRKLAPVTTRLAIFLFCLATVWHAGPIQAQTGQSLAELKQRATELTRQTRYTEAFPLLEKIVAAEPDNAQMHFYFGFALLGQATNTKDQGARKALRIRARNEFIKAKELEVREPVID